MAFAICRPRHEIENSMIDPIDRRRIAACHDKDSGNFLVAAAIISAPYWIKVRDLVLSTVRGKNVVLSLHNGVGTLRSPRRTALNTLVGQTLIDTHHTLGQTPAGALIVPAQNFDSCSFDEAMQP